MKTTFFFRSSTFFTKKKKIWMRQTLNPFPFCMTKSTTEVKNLFTLFAERKQNKNKNERRKLKTKEKKIEDNPILFHVFLSSGFMCHKKRELFYVMFDNFIILSSTHTFVGDTLSHFRGPYTKNRDNTSLFLRMYMQALAVYVCVLCVLLYKTANKRDITEMGGRERAKKILKSEVKI